MELPAPFGKYELLDRIATGGMAEVYLARSFGVAGFEKRLVIKRIRAELADDPRFVQMFIHEAKIGVYLNHPNVVQVYELGRVGPAYYIAMEHLHGRDLTRLVKTLRADGRKLPVAVCCWVIAEVCRGLAYAHGRTDSRGKLLGLVHQDVSPHNVLLTFDGDVKLVDFGIARLVNTAEGSRYGTADDGTRRPGGGKYAYMSPEQASGREVDHRTDVFSAGIVLWELIVGHRLFQDSDPSEKLRRVQEAVIPDPRSEGVALDEALWRILQRALARAPADRYPSATLFEEDLRAWLFENRFRVGRTELALWMKDTFPEANDQGLHELSLVRMVADVARLEGGGDLTGSAGTPSPQPHDPAAPRLPPPTGERKPVTVLQIDVDGITALSARIEPEKLFVRHFQLLRWVRRIVDRFGGRLHAAVDDQITVLFGVPRTRNEDPVNAIECALELDRRVGELRSKGLRLDLAMGVHFGEITVSRGPGHRVRHVARGDTTRLARKLSAVADHGEILVSERIAPLVEGAFVLVRGPLVGSRGGKEAIPSLRVEGRRSGLQLAGRGPWVRRGQELEVLRDALVTVAKGQRAAVVLHGALGSGKTRLVRELRELAQRRGIPFYAARCAGRSAHQPLHALAGVLRQVLGLDEEAAGDAAARHVERLAQLGLSPRDLESVGTLLGIPVRHAPEPAEVWRGIDRMFDGLGRETPSIVAIDEAQELPHDVLEQLARIAGDPRQSPLLWILMARGPVPAPLAGVGTAIHLAPLDVESTSRLITSLLGAETVDQPLVARVVRTCEGNPLYVKELLTWLLEQGQVTVEEGHASLTEPAADPRLPTSLAALIGARLDALGPGSKGAIQLAAVIGLEFEEGLLAAAIGLDDPSPLLDELSAHGLVTRQRTNRWAFASELIHRAALHGILANQRRDYHRMIALAIEAVHHDALEPWHEALATHCAEGGRPIDAARHAFQAGRAHEDRHELDRARALYRRGVEVLGQADRTPDTWDARVQGEATLNVHLGKVCLALGDRDAGQRALQLALDTASDAGLPWIEVQAHVELGRCYLESGRHDLAGAHLGQARALLRIEPDPGLEQLALEASAGLAFETGRNDEAERLWNDALAHAADDPVARARCEIGLANRYLRVGRHDEATRLLSRALEAARSVGDRILEGRVLNNLGLLHSWAGRHEEALASYRRALEVREGIGYVRGVVINHHNVGDTHFQLGDLARAFVAFQRSQELADEMGWPRGVVLNEVYLAYIHATQGTSGVEGILEATERARALGDAEITTAGSWLAGRFLAEQGRDAEARAQLQQALADARRWELAPMVAMIQRTAESLPA